MKLVLEAHESAVRSGGEPVLDLAFIEQHTSGLEALSEDLRRTSWDDILRVSGLRRAQIERVARIYMQAKAVIVCYGMGLTQHRYGTENVQQAANLLMMRGNFGRPGAGICPVRGHSNVQGDRTVGITETPSAELLDQIEKVFSASGRLRASWAGGGRYRSRAILSMADPKCSSVLAGTSSRRPRHEDRKRSDAAAKADRRHQHEA